eukprot:6121364-Amphidinium_carterae.3
MPFLRHLLHTEKRRSSVGALLLDEALLLPSIPGVSPPGPKWRQCGVGTFGSLVLRRRPNWGGVRVRVVGGSLVVHFRSGVFLLTGFCLHFFHLYICQRLFRRRGRRGDLCRRRLCWYCFAESGDHMSRNPQVLCRHLFCCGEEGACTEPVWNHPRVWVHRLRVSQEAVILQVSMIGFARILGIGSSEPFPGVFNKGGRRLSATPRHHLHRHSLCDEVGHCRGDGHEKYSFPFHHRACQPDSGQAVHADRLPRTSVRGSIVERRTGPQSCQLRLGACPSRVEVLSALVLGPLGVATLAGRPFTVRSVRSLSFGLGVGTLCLVGSLVEGLRPFPGLLPCRPQFFVPSQPLRFWAGFFCLELPLCWEVPVWEPEAASEAGFCASGGSVYLGPHLAFGTRGDSSLVWVGWLSHPGFSVRTNSGLFGGTGGGAIGLVASGVLAPGAASATPGRAC